MKYYIDTEGCKMNTADSQYAGLSLEYLGRTFTETGAHGAVVSAGNS